MYKRKTGGWSQHIDFMLWDIFCLEAALLLSSFLAENNAHFLQQKFYGILFAIMMFVDIVIMVLSDAYRGVIRRSTWQEAMGTLRQTVYIALCLLVFLVMLQDNASLVRRIFFGSAPIYLLLSFAVRVLWKDHLQKRLNFTKRTGLLLVTSASRLSVLLERVLEHNYGTYRLTGIVLKNMTMPKEEYDQQIRNLVRGRKDLKDLRVVSDYDSIIKWVTSHWGDEIYVDINDRSEDYTDKMNEMLEMGLTVHLAMGGMEQIEARNKNVEWICGELTLTASLGYVSGRSLLLKRIMDIIGGLIGCIFTGILTIFVGPAIYFADRGPIFFTQTRIGQYGQKFQMFKFRSMYKDADARRRELQLKEGRGDELMFKMERDPRIIGARELPNGKWKKGVGGVIRDLSIDEFPQFFNVLKGDMSLVGTRPPTVEEWERYEAKHKSRMSTKPGITGLWQVSGRSQIRDFNQVVQLDREYIENWSLLLDIQILLKTILVVIQRKGAV